MITLVQKKANSISSSLLISIFVSFPLLAQQQSIPELIKRVKPPVVAILTYDKEGKELARGSGFFLAPNRILTNWHVIEDAYSANVRTLNEKSFRVEKVLVTDGQADLAILQVNVPNTIQLSPLTITKALPQEGERVLVIGNPFGLEGTISDGLVSAIRQFPKLGSIVQISAPISPGSSGSPVINMQGQVVGIATSQLSEGQNLNFAVPGVRILALHSNQSKSLAQLAAETVENRSIEAQWLVIRGLRILNDFMDSEKFNFNFNDFDDNFNDFDEKFKRAHKQAIPIFIQATQLSPELEDAWSTVGNSYRIIGEHQQALKAFERALKLKPESFLNLFNVADSYSELGEYSKALEGYKVAARFAEDSTSFEMLGGGYKKLKQYDKALEFYRKGNDDLALCGIAGVYLKLKQYNKAVEVYQEVIRRFPKSLWAYMFLGEAYMEMKNYSEALESFHQVIRMCPDCYKVYGNIAWVHLFGLENISAGIEASQQAIQINPNYDDGHYYLGVAYSNNGEKNRALEQYKILNSLNSKLADQLLDFIQDK